MIRRGAGVHSRAATHGAAHGLHVHLELLAHAGPDDEQAAARRAAAAMTMMMWVELYKAARLPEWSRDVRRWSASREERICASAVWF